MTNSKYAAAKVIVASTAGNMLELYDFTLYAILIPFFATQFFPANASSDLSLLMSIGVFALAFVARPVGALIFGYIGDKYGRKISLIVSIAAMSCATIGIGLLPTYADIGIVAPVLLLLCRIVQGLSVGGEFTSAAIFLMEYYGNMAGKSAGFTVASSLVGAIAATIIGHHVMQSSSPNAWRLPFIIGGLLALIGVYIRIIIEEAPAYKAVLQAEIMPSYPLKSALSSNLFEFIMLIGICGYSGAVSYALIAYSNIHLTTILGLPTSIIGPVHLYGLVAFGISTIGFGVLADKLGAYRVLLGSAVAGVVLATPIFAAFSSKDTLLIAGGQMALGVLAGSYCSPQLAYIYKFFPIKVRCSADSLGHGLGMALLGGTIPAIAIFLVRTTEEPLIVGGYLTFCALIGVSFIMASRAAQTKA